MPKPDREISELKFLVVKREGKGGSISIPIMILGRPERVVKGRGSGVGEIAKAHSHKELLPARSPCHDLTMVPQQSASDKRC